MDQKSETKGKSKQLCRAIKFISCHTSNENVQQAENHEKMTLLFSMTS